jgi:hypothetical protein
VAIRHSFSLKNESNVKTAPTTKKDRLEDVYFKISLNLPSEADTVDKTS